MHSNTDTVSFQQELKNKIDNKTKPPGSLGRLEELALQIGTIRQSLSPGIINPHIVVFAADHGIAGTGLVNPYPQAVTAQMVTNFLSGGAAINVFCRHNQIALTVVDAGVNHEWEDNIKDPHFIVAKIRYGTRNYLYEDAMTEAEIEQAIRKGKEIVGDIAATGCTTISFGEMGIGNTSSASLIMSALMQLPVEECTGRGTGASDLQMQVKINTLQKVYAKHRLHELKNKPLELLKTVGGFEIAMMTGAYLKAMEERMVIVVDGFIATASLLIAHALDKKVLDFCVFAHTSGEQGHKKMLEYLGAAPLLHLDLRLGEGTGAALAIPLLRSAVAFVNEMATFESAGISNKEETL